MYLTARMHTCARERAAYPPPTWEPWREQVVAPLRAWREEHPGTRVYLQPAATDAHHLPVHPQPPFAAAAGLEMLPAPAHLDIAGRRISISPSQVVLELASSEWAKTVRAVT